MDAKNNRQQSAVLRVCARCEWIYKKKEENDLGCPQCGFATYGARFIYGDKAYQYAETQEPWKKRKLANYEVELNKEIRAKTDKPPNILEQLSLKPFKPTR